MPDYFPMIQPEIYLADEEALPLYQECQWDFFKGQPVFKNGNPSLVTGKQAVKVWVWKTLHTVLGRHEIYNHDHGHQLEELVGQNYVEATKKAEAIRYVREALEVNPYITEIAGLKVNFEGSKLSIHGRMQTIYGEVTVHVL